MDRVLAGIAVAALICALVVWLSAFVRRRPSPAVDSVDSAWREARVGIDLEPLVSHRARDARKAIGATSRDGGVA